MPQDCGRERRLHRLRTAEGAQAGAVHRLQAGAGLREQAGPRHDLPDGGRGVRQAGARHGLPDGPGGLHQAGPPDDLRDGRHRVRQAGAAVTVCKTVQTRPATRRSPTPTVPPGLRHLQEQRGAGRRSRRCAPATLCRQEAYTVTADGAPSPSGEVVRRTPFTRYVKETAYRQVPCTITRTVRETAVRRVPVTTCRMVTTQHVKQVPVTVCRTVRETCVKPVPVDAPAGWSPRDARQAGAGNHLRDRLRAAHPVRARDPLRASDRAVRPQGVLHRLQAGPRDDDRLHAGHGDPAGDRGQERLRAEDDLQAGARRGVREECR